MARHEKGRFPFFAYFVCFLVQIKQANDSVVAATDQAFSFGPEGDGLDAAFQTLYRFQQLAGIGMKNMNFAAVVCRLARNSEQSTIRAKGDGFGLNEPGKIEGFLAAAAVPDMDAAGTACRC